MKKSAERRSIMDKFPSIEKLAAYFDGNLPQDEMLQISKMAEENGPLHALMDDYAQIEDTELSYLEQKTQLPDDIAGEGFRIPDIDNLEIISPVDDSFWNDEGLFNQGGFNADELNQVSETLKNNNEMATNYRTYGETGENIRLRDLQQPDNHSCGLESQRIVLRDYGIDIPFADLEQIAKEAGVYSDQGTRTIDLGEVLEMAGVGVHKVLGANVYDLINEFAQGHRVIVSLDADELWHNNTMSERLSNWMHDVFGGQGGNHALVVAGVEVNPNNTNDIKIVLTDPGTGHLRIEYPFDQFANAWKDSNCFMVATNDAAPYQYDSEKDMYVPSNFYSEYYFNDFINQHGYQLSPSLIGDYPMGYQPAFTGHLDIVGGLMYDDYLNQYNAGNIDFPSLNDDSYGLNSINIGHESLGGSLPSNSHFFNNDANDLLSDGPDSSMLFGGAETNLLGGDTECAGSVGSSILEKGESSGGVGLGVDYLEKSSESTGSVGSSFLDKGESTGNVGIGFDYLDKSCESTGSVGLSVSGDGSETTGSVGSSYLGDVDAESLGSVGISYLGDGSESDGSVGESFNGDNIGGIEYGA